MMKNFDVLLEWDYELGDNSKDNEIIENEDNYKDNEIIEEIDIDYSKYCKIDKKYKLHFIII